MMLKSNELSSLVSNLLNNVDGHPTQPVVVSV